MSVRLLTEHHLEILRLKGGCKGLSESTLVKMQTCWKSHVIAQIVLRFELYVSQYIQVKHICTERSFHSFYVSIYHVLSCQPIVTVTSFFCLQSYQGLIIGRSLVY